MHAGHTRVYPSTAINHAMVATAFMSLHSLYVLRLQVCTVMLLMHRHWFAYHSDAGGGTTQQIL
jgi:hypothetical protein